MRLCCQCQNRFLRFLSAASDASAAGVVHVKTHATTTCGNCLSCPLPQYLVRRLFSPRHLEGLILNRGGDGSARATRQRVGCRGSGGASVSDPQAVTGAHVALLLTVFDEELSGFDVEFVADLRVEPGTPSAAPSGCTRRGRPARQSRSTSSEAPDRRRCSRGDRAAFLPHGCGSHRHPRRVRGNAS